VVAKLITASGFAPVNVGGVDQSVRIEAFGELSEYGKLGRLVTSKEARPSLVARPLAIEIRVKPGKSRSHSNAGE